MAEKNIVVAGLLLAVLPFATDGSARLTDGYEQPVHLAWTCPTPPPDMTLEVVVLTGHDYGSPKSPAGELRSELQDATLTAERSGKQTYLSVEGGESLTTLTEPILVEPNTYVVWRYLIPGLESGPFDGVEVKNNWPAAVRAVLTLGRSLAPAPRVSRFSLDCDKAERLRRYQLGQAQVT